jgi:hypothetical protein
MYCQPKGWANLDYQRGNSSTCRLNNHVVWLAKQSLFTTIKPQGEPFSHHLIGFQGKVFWD